MTIIVGRGRTKATQRIEINDMTVSREHCWLTDNGDGTYTLQNKSPQGTFVDGRQVVKTKVTPETYVKLSETTTVKVADLLPLKADMAKPQPAPGASAGVNAPKSVPSPSQQQVPEFSVRGLETVWKQYEDKKRELAHKQHSMGVLVRMPMLFTAATGILSAVLPPEFRPFTIVLTLLSALVMVYGFMKQKSFVYQDEMDNLNKWMMDNYVCPNPKCRHFIGLKDYRVLRTDKKCGFCGCKLTDK